MVGADDASRSSFPQPVGAMRKKAVSIEALGLTGIAYAVLALIASFLVERLPALDADDATLNAWLADSGNRDRITTAAYIAVFASIALLWFIGALRHRIGVREDRLFATIFLGSGLVFMATTMAAYACLLAPIALMKHGATTGAAASFRLGHGLWITLLLLVSTRMAAMMMLSLSNLGRITRALPNRLILLSIATALVLLVSATFVTPIAWVFPGWTFIVGAMILVRRRRLPATGQGAGPGARPAAGEAPDVAEATGRGGER